MSKEKMKIEDDNKVNIVIRLDKLKKLESSKDVLDRLIDMNEDFFGEESIKNPRNYCYISGLSMDLDQLRNVKDFVDSIEAIKNTS